MTPGDTVLVAGATGYVARRLIPRLLAEGRRVRALVRRRGLAIAGVEEVEADLLKPETLERALEGVRSAVYLVHAMDGGPGFEGRDRKAAQAFGEAARKAGVHRIVYLGGLGDPGSGLSPHLRSRQEVGDLLRASGVDVVEFRASIVLGGGSLSFEMIRALVERLPVMLCPRWVASEAQPICIDDVVSYLAAGLDVPPGRGRSYEIGGPDRSSYAGLMLEYARLRGLRRMLVRVPVLTPGLSSLWLGLVTPLLARVGRILVESIKSPTVVRDPSASRDFAIRPIGMRQSMERALSEEQALFARESAASLARSPEAHRRPFGAYHGGFILDCRGRRVAAEPAAVVRVLERLDGRRWPYVGGLWAFRHFLESLVGARSAPWRRETAVPGRRVRLHAGLAMPGRAFLDFEVEQAGEGSLLRQTAVFQPRGLAGQVYWGLLWPIHGVVFDGLLGALASAAGRSRRR